MGPHPLHVAPGQVVVDRDQVDALAGERVQVERQRGHQRLAPRRSSSRRSCPRWSTIPPDELGRRSGAARWCAGTPPGWPRNASGRRSSRVSPPSSRRRNSPVFSRSSASVSFSNPGSSPLMCSTTGESRLTLPVVLGAEDLPDDVAAEHCFRIAIQGTSFNFRPPTVFRRSLPPIPIEGREPRGIGGATGKG